MNELLRIALFLVPLLSSLQTTGVVTGQLVSKAGFPASGIRVAAMAVPDANLAISTAITLVSVAMTDAAGRYRLENIPPGRYYMTAGLVEAPTYYPGVPSTNGATVVNVTAGSTVSGINFTMTGSVAIENGGLRPRFTLSFVPYKGGVNPVSVGMSTNGTFSNQIAEGEHRLTWSGIPAGYYVKSATAGSVDLLAYPLKIVTGAPTPPIVIMLGVASPVPWVKVSGKVTGMRPQPGVTYRVNMNGNAVLDNLDVAVNADGSFEFPRVLPGSYTARVTPALPIPATSLYVTNNGLSDIQIVLPAMKEVTGRVLIEGLSQVSPRLTFTMNDATGSMPSTAAAQPDGSFKVMLPEGERRVGLNVPGYTVKALTYGSANLLRDPLLKISSSDSAEFQVTLTPSTVGGIPGGIPLGNPTGVGTGIGAGVVGGIVGGVLTGGIIAAPPPPPPPPPAPSPSTTRPTQVIAAGVAQSNAIYSPAPAYPAAAREARVSGTVVLSAIISPEGNVENVTVVTGNALLNDAAISAVRQWRFKPYVVNGAAVRVQTTISVNFALQ